jgi:hypothetical protein
MKDVRVLYQDLLKKGYTQKDAAKEAQARTGCSVVTGRPIRQRGPKHKTDKKWRFSENF